MSDIAYPNILQSMKLDATSVTSATRVLQVFEFFAEVGRPSNAREIGEALGFPQSSTSMLLRSLVSLGYLDFQQGGRTFMPSIRLSLLAGWIPERMEVAKDLLAALAALHEEIGETVILAERHGNFARYIHVLQGPPGEHAYYIRPGTLRPICTNANGRMLLTLATEREVLAIVQRANADEMDPAGRIDREALLAALRTCRTQGYSRTERVRQEFTAVQHAVLLPAQPGGRRLTVGVATDKKRYLRREAFLRDRLAEMAG